MTQQKGKKKLKILIDVDGVLRDFIGSLTRIYLREYPSHHVKTVDSRRLENFYPIGKAIYEFMDKTFAEEILLDAPAFPGAVETLQKWEDEFEIVIATAQPPDGRFPTFRWLGRHQVPAKSIHICHEKHRLDGFVLLDDFVDNLESFAATDRLAVCMNRPWNQHWKGPRVKNMQEFFAYLTLYLQKRDENNDLLFA